MNQNKLKIKKSIWEDFKKNLCWGILFHLQGREEDSIKELEKIKTNLKGSGKFKSVSKNLIKFIVGPTKKLRSKQLYERSKILLDIIKDLDNILNSKKGGLRLAFECPRNNKKGKANDSTRNGYSRDPFKRIKPSLKRNVALATVIYLLRGYATFFCRPRIKRDFNAAKVALNDFFQCSQFAWRLYRLLDNCHSKKGNQHKYLEEVRKGIDYNEPPNPEDSAYFIWSILLMLEIQRGNVYRQIDYLDEASRFYRHSSKRLIRLGSDSIYTFFDKSNIVFQANWDQFITPTLVRSLFEMSKIQFDLGYFLEALINEILCLAFLVKMKIIKRNILANTDKEELIRDLINVVKFLDSKRRQQVFDTEQVGACFGGPSRSEMSLSLNNPIKPSRFKRFINKKDLEFAVDIFARIGFTLFSIQRGYLPIRVWTPKENKKIEDKQVQLKGWISPFFKAHENWSTKKRGVKESPFGQYCMSLFRTPDKKKSQKFLWPSIEKQFAHRLRENTNQKLLDKKALDETEFYEAILAATTGNILNIITIPRRNQSLLMRRGYRSRREEGDLSQKTVLEGVKAALGLKQVRKKGQSRVQNKLIVLRRWQSTNPKIPKPDEYRLRGGGYFLFWQNKGIVIDPGYDFIQNFYDEGFSLSDIDAVVVTHSHPDHDDDLSTLTTLIREWNEYHESTGQGEEKYGSKELDFFLNESTNLKFSAWLKSSQVRIGRVIPLPSVWWDKASQRPVHGKIRGEPVKIDLRNSKKYDDGYNLEMEVMPAWHDDVIGKTEAIGIKFHLYEPRQRKLKIKKRYFDKYSFIKRGIIGYTGDTGAYGYDISGLKRGGDRLIENLYKDCDILLAHLGDIRIRELMSLMKLQRSRHPIIRLFEDWFSNPKYPENPERSHKFTPERVRDFIRFLIALDLVPNKILLSKLQFVREKPRSLCVLLNYLSNICDFKLKRSLSLTRDDLESKLKKIIDDTFKDLEFPEYNRTRKSIRSQILKQVDKALNEYGKESKKKVSGKCIAFTLLRVLCGFSMVPWQYPYHLGTYGLYLLFHKMVNEKRKKNGRIFIVGELPEELASYRHQIARRLDKIEGNIIKSKAGVVRQRVYAFTGDIGLHVNISPKGSEIESKVRCAYCNYNNETVLAQKNYHDPSKILEVPIKRLSSAMIYLCTEKDHYPEVEDFQTHFLNRPNLRVV